MPIVISINKIKFDRQIALGKLRIEANLRKGMRNSMKKVSSDIRTTFSGNPLGFKDRTGALRKSIKGEFIGIVGGEALGRVSVGDNSIGSNDKQTRTYATAVEFGEFSQAGNTAFLRPGALASRPIIVTEFLKAFRRFI